MSRALDRRGRRRWIALAVIVVVVVAAAVTFVATTRWWPGKDLGVNQVLVRASALDQSIVTVRGIVLSSTGGGFIGGGVYVLRDTESPEGQAITVTTSEPLPPIGSVVRLEARVRVALVVNGQSLGTVLQEQRRLPDPVGWVAGLRVP